MRDKGAGGRKINRGKGNEKGRKEGRGRGVTGALHLARRLGREGKGGGDCCQQLDKRPC